MTRRVWFNSSVMRANHLLKKLLACKVLVIIGSVRLRHSSGYQLQGIEFHRDFEADSVCPSEIRELSQI